MRIVKAPNEVLKIVAEPVTEWNLNTRLIFDAMLSEMLRLNGVGIAAPQIGVSKQMFIVLPEKHMDPLFITNPEIVRTGRDVVESIEGCLSINFKKYLKIRKRKLYLKYRDKYGNPAELNASGKLAVIIQHEMDHLMGRLIDE